MGAAMEYMATDARVPLRALRGSDVAGIVTGFINLWRGVLTRSEFAAGARPRASPLPAASQTRLGLRRERSSRSGSRTSRKCLKPLALTGRRPADFAWMLFASTEGALVFSLARSTTCAPLTLWRSSCSASGATLV